MLYCSHPLQWKHFMLLAVCGYFEETFLSQPENRHHCLLNVERNKKMREKIMFHKDCVPVDEQHRVQQSCQRIYASTNCNFCLKLFLPEMPYCWRNCAFITWQLLKATVQGIFEGSRPTNAYSVCLAPWCFYLRYPILEMNWWKVPLVRRLAVTQWACSFIQHSQN